MLEWNPEIYGPVFFAILADRRVLELGPGTPNPAMRPQLKQLTVARAFAGKKVVETTFATACLAGAWLYHDFLAESHSLSQSVGSPSGSYWHGIMHRREPDYANSKYWFDRASEHPIHEYLHAAAVERVDALDALPDCAFLRHQSKWNPAAFVDLCEKVNGSKTDIESLCQNLQHLEFELLFHHCYQHALGVR